MSKQGDALRTLLQRDFAATDATRAWRQFLVLLLLVPALDVLFRITAAQPSAQRMETIILSALAADIGWHRVTERADQLSQFSFQWPAFDAALLVSAMRWMAIFLVLGGVGCLVYGVLRHRVGHASKAEKPSEVTGGGIR